ncbi:hypothetical protein CAPTEDRAFT_217073 [Capitella teleta]|uniref:Uncharacterized protein n=1 Tax=Capitella teleta TaxID=283909 RepID=R7TSV9_CAPTE|nr:hypothetical protein CAPTEDRAFT_217073 [Capitella teleta]|eukprot:ELT94571.1 hypothetical protein CAPTEDRAFT_217073 [Capitella teleta]
MDTENIHGRKFRVLPPISAGTEVDDPNKVPPGRRKPARSDQVTEDIRILAIGSPAPCGSTQEEFDLSHTGTSFPAITVDKCDEEISKITNDDDDDTESEPTKWTPRQSPSLLSRRSVSIQDGMHKGRTSISPSSSGFLSPTPTSKELPLSSSRSETDISQSFRKKCQFRPQLTIDIDRPPTPWGSHPGTPGSPSSLSPFRSSPRSPLGSPASPRRPVRLLPLHYAEESAD